MIPSDSRMDFGRIIRPTSSTDSVTFMPILYQFTKFLSKSRRVDLANLGDNGFLRTGKVEIAPACVYPGMLG
jgi:hypothetical protein